jgi:hypothetical protein
VRILDPGVNSGTYTPEEVADFDEDDNRVSRARRVTPEEAIPAMTTKAANATPSPAPVTVEATVVEPEVLPQTPEPLPTNEFVMPFGKFKGKGFSELATNTLQALADTKTPSPDAVTAAKAIMTDAKASKEDKTRAEMTVNMSRITDAMKALCLNIIAERAKVQG